MKKVPFVKYTFSGNNFVIVDEIHAAILTEKEKSSFSYPATNVNHGVGSDNFLIIQNCTPKILKQINCDRHYWHEVPDSTGVDFVFRMFEPNGVEALSCANGLMCIAHYLYHQYGINSARIMTEVPTLKPRVITVGTHQENGTNWTNMGHPRKIPPEFAKGSHITPFDKSIDLIKDLKITFRKHDLASFANVESLKISGYLVFTGEPHFVIFLDTGFSLKELSKMIFAHPSRPSSNGDKDEKRVSYGFWLVHHIGTYLNTHYAHIFPQGINVNFAQMAEGGQTFEYRCFERGIFRETYACGTGALAVSFVLRTLNLLDEDPIVAWPHRCRWDDSKGHILVEENKIGWLLYGNPCLLFSGEFLLQRTLEQPNTDIDVAKIQAEQRFPSAGIINTGLSRGARLQVNTGGG